jgi:hypothetical protein
MLDPFRKKSSVLSRFFGPGRPASCPRVRFQTGKPAAPSRVRAQSPRQWPGKDAEGQEGFRESLSPANRARDFIPSWDGEISNTKLSTTMSPAYVDTASCKMLV